MTREQKVARQTAGLCIGSLSCSDPVERSRSKRFCVRHLEMEEAARTRPRGGSKITRRWIDIITYNGETLSKAEWAKRLEISSATLHWRLNHWDIERAMNTIGHVYERKKPAKKRTAFEHGEPAMPEKYRHNLTPCAKCGLRGEHVCTPPSHWYTEFSRDFISIPVGKL